VRASLPMAGDNQGLRHIICAEPAALSANSARTAYGWTALGRRCPYCAVQNSLRREKSSRPVDEKTFGLRGDLVLTLF
jgi:hypothetical protein